MIIEIIILLLAVLSGFLVSYLARDELVQGRKWFLSLIIISGVFAVILFFLGLKIEGLTSVFISIFSFVSYVKSFDVKWTKKFK